MTASMTDKPWFHNGLRFECTNCGNCCRVHGDYAFVYLSEKDIDNISAYLGLGRKEFLDRHCKVLDGWVTLKFDQPACAFLTDDNRCGIYPVRPKQCATWPFFQENLVREVWEGPVKDCCPGVDKGELRSAEEVQRIARENEEWYAS